MRLLLDTHVAIWWVAGDERIAAEPRAQIADPSNQVFVSIVSGWEIALKNGLRRPSGSSIGLSAEQAFGYWQEAGFEIMALRESHIAGVEDLPDIHRDPFDRMLVAQALAEGCRLVTHDRRLGDYGSQVMTI